MSRFSRLTLAAGLIALSLAALPAIAQEQPTGTLALSTQVNGDGTLTPTLTWQTTPAATSCTASGDAAWEGTKAGSGTQTLAPFPTTTPKSYALICHWPGQSSALLTWTPPTQNTDGTSLTNLAGYRIHYGTAAANLAQTVQLANASQTSFTIDSLADGTWFFGVRAYTSQGSESALSNIVSKVIRTTNLEWSQQTGVKVPGAPVVELE